MGWDQQGKTVHGRAMITLKRGGSVWFSLGYKR